MDTYRKNGDIHAATTSVIFGVSYEEAQDKHSKNYKEHRKIAKNVNFGTFYGLFPRGLQKTLKFKAGVEKTVSECEEILESLKHGYKGLTAWQEETKAEAARRMYSEPDSAGAGTFPASPRTIGARSRLRSGVR